LISIRVEPILGKGDTSLFPAEDRPSGGHAKGGGRWAK
jgi:hypothetical protein